MREETERCPGSGKAESLVVEVGAVYLQQKASMPASGDWYSLATD